MVLLEFEIVRVEGTSGYCFSGYNDEVIFKNGQYLNIQVQAKFNGKKGTKLIEDCNFVLNDEETYNIIIETKRHEIIDNLHAGVKFWSTSNFFDERKNSIVCFGETNFDFEVYG